ncbi:MAG TPA: cadherin-like domain-containing protein, partial [Candidatus Acidoferrum sp.]|nr:cadherin-like domain-containing protein [Candidatus Acidoferrum sp.]
ATGTGLTFQWQRDGTNLVEGVDNFTGTMTQVLTNSAVTVADAREATNGYVCLVSGTCSPITNSTQVALTVAMPVTAGSLVSAPNPSLPGAGVTLTDTVTNATAGCPAPTGDVLFKANGAPLGDAVALDVNGLAVLSNSTLPHGSNTVTAEYAGNGISPGLTNAVTQVVNTPPVATNTNASATENQTLVISVDKLLALCSDADGDALAITSAGPTSTNGGTVTLAGGNVTYQPVTDFSGMDQFSFVVSDTFGATATGAVVVTVSPANVPAPNIVVPPAYDSGSGTFSVTFAGIPGLTYSIQWAPAPDGPWAFLQSATADTNGLFEVLDSELPPPPARYYRTAYP